MVHIILVNGRPADHAFLLLTIQFPTYEEVTTSFK